MVITITMPTQASTMTLLLRKALNDADSIRAVAKATGLNHAALVRFKNGQQSLRLDLADELAAYFEVECRRVKRRGKDDK